MLTIGFIGAGHMAQAMIKGWRDLAEVRQIVYAPNSGAAVAEQLQIEAVASIEETFMQSDLLILAMPPKALAEVAPTLQMLLMLAPQKIITSVLGGVSISSLQAALGSQAQVVRTLPNVNVAEKEGYTAIAFAGTLDAATRGAVFGLFTYFGRADELPEEQFGAISALAGSGPAFVAAFVNALSAAAVAQGIESEVADKVALQMVNGTMKVLSKHEQTPTESAHSVMTPGGSTAAGWSTLESEGFAKTIAKTIAATMQKNSEFD
ncbi:pyrroline-5-carboxylate reductase [Weissella soli]|uniref:pyrroline-5-carboxylate reductase n=1 Tax=Weissella soli TaxID=155866 RepID=UPI001F2A4489|nr:pyrroline-5-carboxylate reductase [Weissella soli]GJM48341.1 pyrroline-5-carboxylate reductase [Weissella soli]